MFWPFKKRKQFEAEIESIKKPALEAADATVKKQKVFNAMLKEVEKSNDITLKLVLALSTHVRDKK